MTATHNPKVERALADIEACKTGEAGPDEFLDYVGQLIVKSGDPGAVFARVIALIEREQTAATA
ncbi:hypothetical protein [Streptomyces reticuliscabiei]|uniref:hypothetical protein n=1 Tax=Streptomyces reticuliscabiei TaxID=146821 RepID=UPI000A3A5D7F|nr:hypothetical protein [Streptomyces reticuliscabiei]